jgi:hypothetical protein
MIYKKREANSKRAYLPELSTRLKTETVGFLAGFCGLLNYPNNILYIRK